MRNLVTPSRPALAACALLAISLGGCMVQDNERTHLGTHTHLAAIDKDPDAATQADGDLRALHRRQWRSMTYLVPVDGTAHRHLYRTDASFASADARQRGEHPTALSALTRTDTSPDLRTEAALAPFYAFYDVVRMPVMLFVEPQNEIVYSPVEAWERTPR